MTTNAVRDEAESRIVDFPAARALFARTSGDQVAVTHAARTTLYESPEALRDAIWAADPRLAEALQAVTDRKAAAEADRLAARAQRVEAEGLFADAHALLIEADRREAEALAAERRLHRQLNILWIAAAAGCVLAILARAAGL